MLNGLTTHYVGNGFEAINSMGVGFDTHRHYIRANGRVVMIREDVNGTVQHRYVHTDHLGSVTALTELAASPVVERYSYDAWGLRRNPETWEPAAITSLEKRGYTGHEHLDDVGMIHMNGRVYSPSLGRMLSPDPVTFAPEDAQGYNRYSYVLNNPLRYTDPSGFQPKKVVPIEPSNSPGPREHVPVYGQAPSPNAGYFSGLNAAALAFAGGGGSGGISPGSRPGDNIGPAGNPVAEEETEESEETEFDEQPETQGCRGNHCLSTASAPGSSRNNWYADELFWEDIRRRSGNATLVLAGGGLLVAGAPAAATLTVVNVLTVVNIGSAYMADGADGVRQSGRITAIQAVIGAVLGRTGMPPALVSRITQSFGYTAGMATLDMGTD